MLIAAHVTTCIGSDCLPIASLIRFALSELAARDDLLRACAARSLFGLGVVSRAVD